MAETVTQVLKRIGPCLTTDLIREYVAAGMSDTAARKKVNRAQDGFKRLAGLRFTKNARFIYLESQFGSVGFWLGLERAFYQAGKSYWCTLVALRARGGRCPSAHFPILCGAPAARKGQLSADRIQERLTAIQLIRETDAGDADLARITFVPAHFGAQAESNMQALLLAEKVALNGVKDWARRFGIGSFNQFRTRDDTKPALVSGIAWDLSAPSYVRPLVTLANGKLKPGFFVCDVNLNDVVTKDYVEAFVRKHDMASAPFKVGAIMPMLVGQVFAEDAFSLARQKGILALTVANMFGSDVSKALKELIALLCDLGARAAVDPKKIDMVMSTLTKLEGAAINVRAALFEVVVGSLVKDVEGGYLKIGEVKRSLLNGREAQIDVQLDRGREQGVLVIECKSKIPGARVGLDEVQKWYGDRVPLIYEILSSDGDYTEKPFRFELWSNGPFNDDAVEWLQDEQLDFGSHSVGWRDGAALKTYAKDAKSAAHRKILREHYFNHPLSKAARHLREKLKTEAIFTAPDWMMVPTASQATKDAASATEGSRQPDAKDSEGRAIDTFAYVDPLR